MRKGRFWSCSDRLFYIFSDLIKPLFFAVETTSHINYQGNSSDFEIFLSDGDRMKEKRKESLNPHEKISVFLVDPLFSLARTILGAFF